jgi:NAD(P)-dependent dehydrogenase (short-subunit alcohol dehydrogenase family)
MRPIEERTILITGATSGLGKRVARDLAERGATVLLHGRDAAKGATVMEEIRRDTGNRKLAYLDADLASLDDVRALAAEVLRGRERLDALVNNAGVGTGMREAPRQVSADGYELRLAVNHLAPFLLTHLLLPLLRRSAPARIVHVASVGQGAIDFDDLMLEQAHDGIRAYRQSKLAQVMSTFDLAPELAGSGVTVNVLHPASLMDTAMVRDTDWFAGPTTTVAEGAQAVERLIVDPDLEGVSGEYFDGTERSRAHAQAYDEEARRRLRAVSERLTGVGDHAGVDRAAE